MNTLNREMVFKDKSTAKNQKLTIHEMKFKLNINRMIEKFIMKISILHYFKDI